MITRTPERDIIVIGMFLLIALAASAAFFSVRCDARWADTRPSQWTPISGCLVESNGKMVPEDRIWFERNPD